MKGFMCFYEDMTDLQNDSYEIGKTYKEEDKGKKYVIYENLEDSLRNYHAEINDVIICIVEGLEGGRKIEDTQSEYIERYEFEKIKILKEVPREFIIEYALNLYEFRLMRFLQSFKLTDEEKDKFRLKFGSDLRMKSTIDYYINGKKDAYKEEIKNKSHKKR